eukprot:9498882-Pyramimonas_sp.AAC.1
MDLVEGHTHNQVPQGTADDLTNEFRGPRATQSLVGRTLVGDPQTLFALRTERSLFPFVPSCGRLDRPTAGK